MGIENKLGLGAARFGLALFISAPIIPGVVDLNPPPLVRSIDDIQVPQTVEGWVLEEQVTKEQIEKQFNIQLYTLREDYQRHGRDYPEANPDFASVPQNWEQQHLTVLKTILGILPAHFYQPLPDGKRLEIILSYVNHCRDTDSPQAIPYQIELDHKNLKLETQKDGLESLAHESTHATMPKQITWIPNPIFPDLPPVDFVIESPWFPIIIDDILGGKYQEKAPALKAFISEKKKTTPPDQRELHKFYQDLLWGFGRVDDPYELIAYMAQHHLYGREWMYQMYKEIFSGAQFDKLYSFTRDQLYRGMEYPNFPL